MATFKYQAVSRDGENVNGVISAYDEFEAVDKIKQSCAVVTSITELKEFKSNFSNQLFGSKKADHKVLALICSQFAIVLTAGMPIVRSVEMIANQNSDKNIKKILIQIAEDVSTGHGLAQSFENKWNNLPTTFIETVRSGEETGTLEQAFKKLHVYYDKSSKIKSKVRSAMIYPAFLGVLAAIVIAIIMTVAVPAFAGMFESLGSEMPALTKGLISFSNFMGKNILWIVLVIIIFIIAVKIYSGTEKGRRNMAKLQLKLPVLGNVAELKGASQFAHTMTTAISAGITAVKAVSMTSRVLDNYDMGMRLASASGGLEEGRTIGECMKTAGCFPELLVEMTAVGESTGTLEETLNTIGNYYDSEVEIASAKALNMLQPAITIVMGAVIGFIVIALYLPMFSMYGSI